MKVLIIGGQGFYGRQIATALAQVPDVEIALGGRNGPVAVDLSDPGTFSKMAEFSLVINAADSVTADPTPAARWCLGEGLTWFDIAADVPGVERLLALEETGPGAIVVGVGLFPGVSSALAVAVARGGAVELGIRLSVFSGAGPGIVKLMMRMLTDPSVWWAGGRRQSGPPVGPTASFDFPSASGVKAIRIGLADAPVIHAATAQDVAVHLAPKPGILRVNFRILAWLARVMGRARRLVLAPAAWSLELLRTRILKAVPGRVELVARAGDRQRALAFADGQSATGQAVAAAVMVWRELAEPPQGVVSAATAIPVDPWLAALQALGCQVTPRA